jgi:hypothetical protein
MKRAGMGAKTASVKKIETILGGTRSGSLKIWWISGSFPYRTGFSYCGGVAAGLSTRSMSKMGRTRPSDEPKEPMTMLAWSGFLERRC